MRNLSLPYLLLLTFMVGITFIPDVLPQLQNAIQSGEYHYVAATDDHAHSVANSLSVKELYSAFLGLTAFAVCISPAANHGYHSYDVCVDENSPFAPFARLKPPPSFS